MNQALPPEPTEFQRRVLDHVMSAPNKMARATEVAAGAFPERWANPTSRGALAGHVAKAGARLVARGLLACVLPAKNHGSSPTLCGGFKAHPNGARTGKMLTMKRTEHLAPKPLSPDTPVRS